jgi:predicted MFS family arabinose efflux permease
VRAGVALGRIGVLMGAVFVDMMGFLMVLPLLPFYAERMGASAFTIGVLVGIFAFAQLATAPLWGKLSDRYGRRPVILAGLTTSAAAYFLFGLASSLSVLLLSRLVQGAGGGIAGVIQAYVADAVPGEDRARALGWLTAATSAGVMVGPLVGSLATRLSPQAPGFIAAFLCLINVLFAVKLLREPASREESIGPRQPMLEALIEIFRRPAAPAHVMIWIYTAGMMAFMAMNGVFALYLGRRFGVTEATIGYFYFYVGGISLLMRAVVLGILLGRFGEIAVLRMGAVALALGMALMPLPGHLLPLAATIALVPIGTSMLFPATTSQVSRHARQGHVGQTLGLQQALGGIARMSGPIWAGAAFQHLGMASPFWFAALLMAGAASIAWAVARPAGPRPLAAGPLEGDSAGTPQRAGMTRPPTGL